MDTARDLFVGIALEGAYQANKRYKESRKKYLARAYITGDTINVPDLDEREEEHGLAE